PPLTHVPHLFVLCYSASRQPNSFPTRRSSDLGHYGTTWAVVHQWLGVRPDLGNGSLEVVPQVPDGQTTVEGRDIRLGHGSVDVRSEEHTSELQSRVDLVCRLLLEKKNGEDCNN